MSPKGRKGKYFFYICRQFGGALSFLFKYGQLFPDMGRGVSALLFLDWLAFLGFLYPGVCLQL